MALHELDVCPWPLLIDILEARAYSNMRQYLEQHPTEYPDSPMADTVRDTQGRVQRELIDAMLSR